MTTAPCSTLTEFLKKYDYKTSKCPDKIITHTKIPGKGVTKGGSFYIPENKMNEFYRLYYKHLWEDGKKEFLTEAQINYLNDKKVGPILVDFDFRYNPLIKDRQHTSSHILDIIDLYLEEIKYMTVLNKNITINIYVFEKQNVNCLTNEKTTKDGIHMIISLAMKHSEQCFLRKRILKSIPNIWEDLPLKNDWDSVLDEGISSGKTNWQVFGSRKPNNEAYRMTYMYEANYDNDDTIWSLEEKKVSNFNFKDNLHLISARYTGYEELEIKESIKTDISSMKNIKKQTKLKLVVDEDKEDVPIYKIENQNQLDSKIEETFKDLTNNPSDYYIRETHEFTMILPESYYGPGSYNNWIRVGFALKNTANQSLNYRDNRLFLTFLKFSSQSSEFTYSDVPGLWDKWCNQFQNCQEGGLTNKSIMYWAKCDAPMEAYKTIRGSTVDFFFEEAIKSQAEFDLANVLYQLFKDKYICISVSKNIWFEFKGHRWVESDCGNGLRMAISKDFHNIVTSKVCDLTDKMSKMQIDDENWPKMQVRTNILASISLKLKKTTDKNNIMREARELFYDNDFIEKQDENVFLLGFNNGIYDFKEERFRSGRPEDYIVKSTKIDYIPIDKIKQKYIDEINLFMKQLFPKQELRDYIWEHLASTLIGTTENQTFNIYNGCGRNGKSMLCALMSKVLGEYKGVVPITLVTQKRNSIGNTSPEIVALKGTRYAVMQEPEKGSRINEGIMKELTGGDPIQGRALFKDSITFNPQFKLVVTLNNLFEIKSNDDGTWRRIRVVEFLSKFTENPVQNDPDEPYQFKVDKKLECKFDHWKTAMMSMLIEKVKITKGNVEDCTMVMAKSNEYRNGQDYLSEFVNEKITRTTEGKIKKTEVYNEFKEWYALQHGRNIPKGKELYDFLDKKYGKYKNGWNGIEIIYEMEEE